MKSKQVAVWSEITANDAAIIRETLRVKQSVAQTTKLPSDITMVGLFGASRVELTAREWALPFSILSIRKTIGLHSWPLRWNCRPFAFCARTF